MSLKIAFIGAGSIGFTRRLMTDILCVPELRNNVTFAFTDINQRNLDMVTSLCQRDLEANGVSTKIQSTLDRREALKDAKYVICCARIGCLEGFVTDVEIPLKYGVDQCVGDTICIGGIMYGQRGIAAMLDFCRDMREVSHPDVLLLNYSNPNAMMTWAANVYGGVPTLGLCHGVQGGEHQIAGALKIPHEELDFIVAGINHQTWYLQIKHKGRLISSEELLATYEADEHLCKTEKVRIDILRRFGYYSTESNGHLSEYLAWYRKRPDDLLNWIDLSNWHHGETGGYLRVCTEGRDWFETDFPNWLKEPPYEYKPEKRSHEHGSFIIESLETGRRYRGCFNVMNNGSITNLPQECVVEVPCYADGNGISVTQVGDLPLGCAAVCSQSVWVQKLSVEAAVYGDVMLLKQAAMMDPLTGAVCNPPEISQMVDEMLIAGEEWLPQYGEAIADAKAYFAKGDVIAPKNYQGAARLHTRTAAELAKDKKAATETAANADK
ncbi:MAG: alpha-glucosidase/alpha-galactosidase [Oscillospiraceae bacterium]|jgi:alpha-galactosidase|nr:alpha-glucosidase/alpha-galactosidase [Oscillospiraceae bacterium]